MKASVVKFCGLVLGLAFAFSAAATEIRPLDYCEETLQSAPLSLDVLRDKGLPVENFEFRFIYYNRLSFEIRLMVDGVNSGHIEMNREPFEKQNVYRSASVYVREDFIGRGVGAMLYLVAARFLNDELGAGLRSDVSRSELAVAAWRRFLKQGLVQEFMVYGPFNTPIDRYTMFRPERLEAATAEIYPFFSERLNSPEALAKLRSSRP